jgi:gamma-carbonic anhydrase
LIIKECRGKTPKIAENVFIAENAVIIGDVEIGEGSSIWYNVVLRGDVMPIRIGKEANIQDGTIIHGTFEEYGTTIGDRVTVGHLVMLHGCEIKSGSLIGMGAIIMDGVEVGEHCLVGAGTLITEGKKFSPQSLIVGRPGAVKRALSDAEIKNLEESADNYLMYKSWYKA